MVDARVDAFKDTLASDAEGYLDEARGAHSPDTDSLRRAIVVTEYTLDAYTAAVDSATEAILSARYCLYPSRSLSAANKASTAVPCVGTSITAACMVCRTLSPMRASFTACLMRLSTLAS